MTKIAVFVGSLQENSYNKKLAKNIERLASENIEFCYVDLADLPLFNQELEANLPDGVKRMKDVVETSDGVLFVTPEYNRSISGVLKNAIDWASRPNNSFSGKPAGIVGASTGKLGTASAQNHLRSIVVYLNMKLLGQPEIYFEHAQNLFDENGAVIDSSRSFLERYIDTFTGWVNTEHNH